MAFLFNDDKTKLDFDKAVQAIITPLQTAFQNNINTIYNAVKSAGVTPSDKSPSNIATAISNLRKTPYTQTYTFPQGDSGGRKDLGVPHNIRYVNAQNVYSAGVSKGYDLGHDDGYNAGYGVGYNAGHSAGYSDGRAQGRADETQHTLTLQWTVDPSHPSNMYLQLLYDGTLIMNQPSVQQWTASKTIYTKYSGIRW